MAVGEDGREEEGHSDTFPPRPNGLGLPLQRLHWDPGGASLLAQACRQALEEGDEDAREWLDACDQGRTWAPLEWKKLKELKQAAESYGIDSPYVKELLALLARSTILTPNDWKTLAKVVLKPGESLQWMTAFADIAKTFVRDMQSRTPQADWQKIVGVGKYETNEEQLKFDATVYAAVSQVAQRTFQKIQPSGKATPALTKIRQKPFEPFSDFVARLQAAAMKLIGQAEAAGLITQRLARENANATCQKVLVTLDSEAG
ncbi:endogenous retrovirus group K member 6 Gag polyprotein-like [Phascolarctos cinereus]